VDHWYGQEGPPLALLSNAPRLDAFVNLRYRRVWFEGGLEILKRDLPTRAGLIRPVIK